MIRVTLKSLEEGGNHMAGSDLGSSQSKKSSRQNGRLGPGMTQNSSRVSNVVGNVGSQNGRNGQRANSSSARQGSRAQSSSAGGSNRGKQGTKKASPPAANRPPLASSPG